MTAHPDRLCGHNDRTGRSLLSAMLKSISAWTQPDSTAMKMRKWRRCERRPSTDARQPNASSSSSSEQKGNEKEYESTDDHCRSVARFHSRVATARNGAEALAAG